MLENISHIIGIPPNYVLVLGGLFAAAITEYIFRNIYLHIPYFQKKREVKLEHQLLMEAHHQIRLADKH